MPACCRVPQGAMVPCVIKETSILAYCFEWAVRILPGPETSHLKISRQPLYDSAHRLCICKVGLHLQCLVAVCQPILQAHASE